MKKIASIPLGVLLIAGFYIFGAIVVLAFLLIDPAQVGSVIAERHGLPTAAANSAWPVAGIASLALLLAYGLTSLSRWGYVLTNLYLVFFGMVNAYLLATRPDINLADLGSLVWALVVILYLFIVRKRFYEKRAAEG